MYFRIGNEIQIGGNSPYQLEPGIEGLGSADIRTGDGLYAGVDGGYVSSQLYGTRTITLTGFYVASNCEQADELRRNLTTKLHIRYLYPIFIHSFGGSDYFVEGYITDIKADIDGVRANEFQITILCPDPIIYDGGDGEDPDSVWREQRFFPAGGGDNTIKNDGMMEVYPIITLQGILHTPTITNQTTNQFLTLARNLTAEQTVTIDMKERLIILNDSGISSSVASSRSITSSWWTLAPGDNTVVLSSLEAEDMDYATIRYKVGYGGI